MIESVSKFKDTRKFSNLADADEVTLSPVSIAELYETPYGRLESKHKFSPLLSSEVFTES